MNTLDEYHEELNCRHCGKTIQWNYDPWSYYHQWSIIKSRDKLILHEKNCELNPNGPNKKLFKDIARCKTQTRISECLNCQHYQKKCNGTKNKNQK